MNRSSPPRLRTAALLAVAFLAGACAEIRVLMPTPNYYAAPTVELFGTLPDAFTTTKVELIYVTDQVPE